MACLADVQVARRTLMLGGLGAFAGCVSGRGGSRGGLLYADDFRSGLGNWAVEAERPGRIVAADGVLDIDVPAGVTLWFRPRLTGPVAIDYVATPVVAGGRNDTGSDVNCFWMARDPGAFDGDVLRRARSGAFAGYDTLLTYYAGIGGNRNTTTRFRRYVGQRDNRPLLPRHDLSDASSLLVPNQPVHLRLIADGRRVAVIRDGVTLFTLDDPSPYTRGHFGLRTTWSHLRISDFRVWRI